MKKIVLLAILALVVAAPSAVARPGALDRDFGRNGKVIGGGWGGFEFPAQTAVARDGSILTAVSEDEGEYVPVAYWEKSVKVRRYLPHGRVDTAFGDGGTVTFRLPPGSPRLVFDFSDLAVDHSGRPLLFGQARGGFTSKSEGLYGYSTYPTYAAVIRLTVDGRLDSSFGGGDGIAMFDFGIPASADYTPPGARASMGKLDPRGRIVFVVALREQDHESPRSFIRAFDRLLARVTPAGDLDQSFGGGDGIAPLDPIEPVASVSFGPDEEITVAGSNGGENVQLLRLDGNGVPVERFGNGGFRVLGGLSFRDAELDRSGRTLLLGKSVPGAGRLGPPQRVVRLGRDGALDRSFGVHGHAAVRVRGHARLASIVSEPTGRVLLAGTFPRRQKGVSRTKWPREIGLVRLRSGGDIDRTFGSRGRAFARFGRGARALEVSDAALGGNGRLVLSALVRLRGAPPHDIRQALLRFELK